MKVFKKNRLWIRTAIQVFFFALVAMIVVNHQLVETGRGIPFLASASLHSICPFGGVETFYQWAMVGTMVRKVHEASLVLMGIVFVLAILVGPVFCGWICPLGSIQEWVSKIGKRLFRKRFNRFIPASVDRYFRYARYLMLIWVLYMTARSGQLAFETIDPYYALFNFWTSEVAIGGLLVLLVTLLGSLFVERPWCKYACPYGALLGLTNLFRFFKIKRVASTCIDCNKCNRSCPMNINVSQAKAVLDHQCITCLECTSEAACPVDDTVNLVLGGQKS
jgi:polyferredoxin